MAASLAPDADQGIDPGLFGLHSGGPGHFDEPVKHFDAGLLQAGGVRPRPVAYENHHRNAFFQSYLGTLVAEMVVRELVPAFVADEVDREGLVGESTSSS